MSEGYPAAHILPGRKINWAPTRGQLFDIPFGQSVFRSLVDHKAGFCTGRSVFNNKAKIHAVSVLNIVWQNTITHGREMAKALKY